MSYIDKFKMNNKNVFVTGGSGLIGNECVTALLDAGANVVVLDVNEPVNLHKVTLGYEYFDIANLERIDENINSLVKKYGTIDCWINIAYPRTSSWADKVEHLKLSDWRHNVDMHLNSYSWTSRAAALVMKRQGFGSIINFGSIYGSVAPDFSIYDEDSTCPMAYAAIKGGIENLTKYIASYFGKYNVRANTIAPGGVYNGHDEAFVEKYEGNTLLSRMANPEDVASVLLFLASDASSYVTGQTIMVDGGWTAL